MTFDPDEIASKACIMFALLKNQGIIDSVDPLTLISIVLTMVTGTMFVMWLGELITEYGIGNGISLLIFAGIVGRLPVTFGKTITFLLLNFAWMCLSATTR